MRSLLLCASAASCGRGRCAARAEGPTGLNVPIGDASRSDQEYVWISNASNLPLFVERVYPGLEVGAQGAQRQGPHRRPDLGRPRRLHHHGRRRMHQEPGRRDRGRRLGRRAGVGGRQVHRQEGRRRWSPTATCRCPSASPISGTNWYNLGYQHGQYQCRYHKDAGLKAGQIGTISFLAASNFIQARQGLRDALAKECPDVKVVADEESGTNVEQVAANTAAIIQGHPDLTGMVGFDSEAGPGIVRAVTEAGKSRQDHHHLERGRPRLPRDASRTAR